MASPAPTPQTNLGVAPNVGGLLCYAPCCIGLIFSAVAAIVEKQSRILRFHAFQSLLLHAAFIVVGVGLQVVHIALAMVSAALGLLFSLVGLLVSLGMLAFLIFMMIKANNLEEYRLPVIGDMASRWV